MLNSNHCIPLCSAAVTFGILKRTGEDFLLPDTFVHLDDVNDVGKQDVKTLKEESFAKWTSLEVTAQWAGRR